MERRLVFEGVWKRFRRGQVHDSLRDLIPAITRKLLGRGESNGELGERDFWALRDVSFDVRPGEVLGIIGGNGAGKSTTLKILNDLMEPTRGRVVAEGKIGSLIEVSAGFHPDLTGRQNVFLQGAIMGMRDAEVRRKFDQIVDFAGVSDFIDTPVKRYSSGMNARLGFSIAAHLEPEILIIDEVLAVGDHMFQTRAFGKIRALAQSGIPVVLVSHQLDRIAELATKAILLEKGHVKVAGTPTDCINAYLNRVHSEATGAEIAASGFRFDGITPLNGVAINSGEDLSVTFSGACLRDEYPPGWQLAVHVSNADTGDDVTAALLGWRGLEMPLGREFEYRIDVQMNVRPGKYRLECYVWDADRQEEVVIGAHLYVDVLEKLSFGGSVQCNLRWREIGRAKGGASRVEAVAPAGEVALPAG